MHGDFFGQGRRDLGLGRVGPILMAVPVDEMDAVAVAAELAAAGFGEVESYPDLAGWPRLVVGRWH